MNFSYEENEKKLNEYIESCRKKIKNMFFTEEELESSTFVKSDLIASNQISQNVPLSDAIKIHRNNMIDIKLNHTMRVVEDVTRMSQKMNLNIDFEKVLKVSALLHDIARFEQAVYSNSFNDRECKQFNGMYHAEAGYHLLYVNNKFKDFNIPHNYKYAISQVVKYHQIPRVTGDLAILFNNPEQLNVNYLTGNESLNDQEKVIVAALLQMVKDVDMLDILYQHLTGEFPVTRNSFKYDVENDTLQEISRNFGISEKEIKEFNGLISDDITDIKTVSIPTQNIDPIKLKVPDDIQRRFFNNESLDLKELQNRRDWTFITGMWWRLNHFLNNINFVSNLEVVEENRLLEQIYNTYEDKYKPLVAPAFEFAKQELLEKAIKNNQGQIYKTK